MIYSKEDKYNIFISNLDYLTSIGWSERKIAESIGKYPQYFYSKVKEWVLRNYNTPDKVIKADIENSYIRINGFEKNIASYTTLGTVWFDADYTISIDIKDYRCRLTLLINKISAGNYEYNCSTFFKSPSQPRKMYTGVLELFDSYFNALSYDLDSFIKKKKMDDW